MSINIIVNNPNINKNSEIFGLRLLVEVLTNIQKK